ncbi:MAG: hypothetical protein H7Z75_13210 [Ferruginibacter sp.]|nr:hypothetical protein [Cytophagales bacterium]
MKTREERIKELSQEMDRMIAALKERGRIPRETLDKIKKRNRTEVLEKAV